MDKIIEYLNKNNKPVIPITQVKKINKYKALR